MLTNAPREITILMSILMSRANSQPPLINFNQVCRRFCDEIQQSITILFIILVRLSFSAVSGLLCITKRTRYNIYCVSLYFFELFIFQRQRTRLYTSSVSPVYYTGCLIDSWKIFFSATFASFPGSRLLRHETFVEELKTA